MSTAIDPWPPADPVDPQPYDQRGCCWPWGPGGPIHKLPMRYGLDFYRSDGNPLGADWDAAAHSYRLYQIDVQGNTILLPTYTMPTFPIICAICKLDIIHITQEVWSFSIGFSLFGPPVRALEATGNLPTTAATTAFDFPLGNVSPGGGGPPDMGRLTPVQWWEAGTAWTV